jgi:hypothetical protein
MERKTRTRVATSLVRCHAYKMTNCTLTKDRCLVRWNTIRL